jgi:hypothetical protein
VRTPGRSPARDRSPVIFPVGTRRARRARAAHSRACAVRQDGVHRLLGWHQRSGAINPRVHLHAHCAAAHV